jgi:hypothetical protein
MFASLLINIEDWSFLFANPIRLAMTASQIWMLIHAIRNREWIWALFFS